MPFNIKGELPWQRKTDPPGENRNPQKENPAKD
jgi:hypothetical protein